MHMKNAGFAFTGTVDPFSDTVDRQAQEHTHMKNAALAFAITADPICDVADMQASKLGTSW